VTQRVQIDKVLYVGHEGGIACGLKISGHADRAIVVSLTHLCLESDHPLAKAIHVYQRDRTRKLARGY
jgi:hypothetical protein